MTYPATIHSTALLFIPCDIFVNDKQMSMDNILEVRIKDFKNRRNVLSVVSFRKRLKCI